jgi:hypothetical protein
MALIAKMDCQGYQCLDAGLSWRRGLRPEVFIQYRSDRFAVWLVTHVNVPRMEFEQTELDAIERACRAQANDYRDLAMKTDRPIQRNQRIDAAAELERIANQIQQHRRDQAMHDKGCTNRDD